MTRSARALPLLGRGSRVARWVVGAVVGLSAVTAAGVAWIVKVREDVAPPAPALYVQARYREVSESPGHAVHVGLTDVSCASCHAETDGGLSRPTARVCGRCHEDARPAIHPRAEASAVGAEARSWDHAPSCQGCHRFTNDRDYAPDDCMRCHLLRHAAVRAIVEHATTICARCHRAHAEPSLATTSCLDCHERHPTEHGEVQSPTGCLTCHRVHEARELSSIRCAECHGERRNVR